MAGSVSGKSHPGSKNFEKGTLYLGTGPDAGAILPSARQMSTEILRLIFKLRQLLQRTTVSERNGVRKKGFNPAGV